MASPLRTGQIVWAAVADANGIKKARPAIVVTPDERITEGGSLELVAITSRVSDPLPDDHVLLPWHAQGHPRTGLNRKCAAVCGWIARIETTDIQNIAGLISGKILEDILSKVASMPPSA
ncbi:MAG: type II toxin-antitoxin system PemK/MazF family toxin [Planctomycetes bacterium]|nr:type II toxin-antitoxin system PemK/MazF family toxin [Planctomycetota bacterium]